MSVNNFDILLIDDDEDDYVNIHDLFKEISSSRYNITWRPSYREGLEALQLKSYDACLLDYRLGEHTGLDLLMEVQKLGVTCPMILLTGQGDFDLDLQAMQTGAADYLVKGQLTAHLLERSIRYSMKHSLDLKELQENKAQILQQDRLASLGLLASSLAHEIGTPLGIIRSRAELAEKKSGENESLKGDMSVIISQIDRITKMVNSLLHLARGSKSELTSDVDLGAVIEDILNLLQHELARKGITFELNLKESCRVRAEAGPLGQVLLNLLVNAVHAIEESAASGRKEFQQIILNVKNQNGFVQIEIKDTGCGIPEKYFSQLFKPFFTTKGIGSGTGLGLATSLKIVQSWGGSLTVESTIGVGSTFRIQLRSA